MIVWTSSAGAEITISARRYLDEAIVCATVAGKAEPVSAIKRLPAPLLTGGQVIVATVGRVGLTAERLAAVQAEAAALQAAINAEPAVQLRRLLARRQHLAERVGHAMNVAHETEMYRVEHAAAHGWAPEKIGALDAAEVLARSELSAFDAEHPEVLEVEKAERAKRLLELGRD